MLTGATSNTVAPIEQLNAGLRHPQFLQQARPITVQPLRFRLIAIPIPFLGPRMLDVLHVAILAVLAARSRAFTRHSAAT